MFLRRNTYNAHSTFVSILFYVGLFLCRMVICGAHKRPITKINYINARVKCKVKWNFNFFVSRKYQMMSILMVKIKFMN